MLAIVEFFTDDSTELFGGKRSILFFWLWLRCWLRFWFFFVLMAMALMIWRIWHWSAVIEVLNDVRSDLLIFLLFFFAFAFAFLFVFFVFVSVLINGFLLFLFGKSSG